MEINELTELMKAYESKLISKFAKVYVTMFSDGSGTLIESDYSAPEEELLEFDNLDELYEFLTK